MKKIIAGVLASFMTAAALAAFAVPASAVSYSVTDICDYTITTKNVGFPHYRDNEGEQDLFDGVLPTKAELDEAAAGYEVEANREWYVWEGWTAVHSTGTDSYKTNEAVNIDFAFDEPVYLSQIIPHTASMATGNVCIASTYEIYTSDDGVNYTLVKAQPTEIGYVNYKYEFDDTIISLDEPVLTQYFRLVATGVTCWWFCSEIELYAENLDDVIDVDSEEPAQSSEATDESSSQKPTTETGDNGVIALAVVASLAVVGAVSVKKYRR